MNFASLPSIVMVSSPSPPYDAGEMRSESDTAVGRALSTRPEHQLPLRGGASSSGAAPSRHWFRTSMPVALSPSIVMMSSPFHPYDAGEMRSESRPHALDASRASTSSPRRYEHFVRAFQTLVSHFDVFSTVAHNRDGVIAIISL